MKKQIGVPVLTDVHEDTPLKEVAAVVDVIQTPAFLCRQTNFIRAAAQPGKPVNIKKGQFLSPWEMKNVVEKAKSTGNQQILVCERGFSFGYNNLVVDMRGLADHARHRLPGGVRRARTRCSCPAGRATPRAGSASSSRCWRAPRSAPASRGVFMETHPKPDEALCDGPNSWPLAPDAGAARYAGGAGSTGEEKGIRGKQGENEQ